MRVTPQIGRMNAPLTEEEKNNSPKITKALLKRVFSYLLAYKGRLFLVFLAIAASSALGVLPSILTGKIIDEGLIGKNFDLLVNLALASLGVLCLSALIGVFESYMTSWISQHIVLDMKSSMYSHLLGMPHSFYTSNRQGDIITRITSDINGVQTVVSDALTRSVKNIAIVAATAFALFQKNWILALVGIAIVPLFTIPTDRVGRRRWGIALKVQEQRDITNQLQSETLSVSGQLLTKLFTREEQEQERFYKAAAETTSLVIKERMAGRWFWMFLSVFTNIGPMLIYVVGGIMLIKYNVTSLSVGDITVIVTLLGRLYRPVEQLLNIQVDITRSMALFTRIFEYYDLPITIKSPAFPKSPSNIKGTVTFDNVSFSYDGVSEVLSGISYEFSEGKTVAVVGPSGAGKTTISNLIPRLYDVTGGRVLIDGVDVKDFDLKALRQNIGVVTQETYLFNATIRENLLYSNPSASPEDVENACRAANIHDFIVSLPEGYDTVVGNRGFKLSGGQKQRLSIARIVLRDPKILILDEATSSLDSISEKLVQDALEPLLKGRTSIVIAHRLSTIMQADDIIVIDEGRISEQGTHQELSTRGGIYGQLCRSQFIKAE